MKYNQDIAITRNAIRQFRALNPIDPPQQADEEDLAKEAEFELKRLWAQASYVEDNYLDVIKQTERRRSPVIHFRSADGRFNFFVVGQRMISVTGE